MSLRWICIATIAVCATQSRLDAGIVYGVTGSGNNGGTPNTIFSIDTNTGATSAIGTTAVTPNGLGKSKTLPLFYYGNHGNDDFYVFNASTGTNTKLADTITDFGTPAGSRFSGPADFHQGRYYFIPESATGQPFANSTDVYYVDFDSTGLTITASGSISVTMPVGTTGFGDFGDIAIDPKTGILYGQSLDRTGDQVDGVFTVDILNADPTLTVINSSVAATTNTIQLAFNGQQQLFGNRYDTVAEIFSVNTTTGAFGAATPLVGTTADFFDMATGVPEPSSILLCSLAGITFVARRRKKSTQRCPNDDIDSAV